MKFLGRLLLLMLDGEIMEMDSYGYQQKQGIYSISGLAVKSFPFQGISS